MPTGVRATRNLLYDYYRLTEEKEGGGGGGKARRKENFDDVTAETLESFS